MTKKLYVGNLPFNADNNDLSDYFAQVGEVASAVIINDKMSGRSKGFGFVEMTDDSAADEAIERLNGQEFNGRRLVVSEARPLEERPARDNNRPRFRRD